MAALPFVCDIMGISENPPRMSKVGIRGSNVWARSPGPNLGLAACIFGVPITSRLGVWLGCSGLLLQSGRNGQNMSSSENDFRTNQRLVLCFVSSDRYLFKQHLCVCVLNGFLFKLLRKLVFGFQLSRSVVCV